MKSKNSNSKRKALKNTSKNHDPFDDGQNSKRRKKGRREVEEDDDEIQSGESEELEDFEDYGLGGSEENCGKEQEDEDEFKNETAEEMRLRLAKQHLAKVKALEEVMGEDEEDEEKELDRYDKERHRDSLVSKILLKDQLEKSRRARREIASSLQIQETVKQESRLLVKHRQSVTAVALSGDDARGFSVSKDGSILHWDVESGKSEKYAWPKEEVLKSHGAKEPHGKVTRQSRHILALAVSSDGRYLATGGLDRHVHLWDTRTRGHIKAFPGHRGPVSCVSFREKSSELFSGSYDRTVKIWNAEDRVFITTLFGHQNEVIAIDCLEKERALTVARDRTMRLWKVPEESQLVFRAPSSALECCCFVGNDTFLSGSDDGSIELWSINKKKPSSIVKNAHDLVSMMDPQVEDNKIMCNGDIESHSKKVSGALTAARSWVSSVAVCNNSDLAASGAGNGCVRLWTIEDEARGIKPLLGLPMAGFVNSLAFAHSARFLIAGVGQEQRLGRWARIQSARNGVLLQPLKLS